MCTNLPSDSNEVRCPLGSTPFLNGTWSGWWPESLIGVKKQFGISIANFFDWLAEFQHVKSTDGKLLMNTIVCHPDFALSTARIPLWMQATYFHVMGGSFFESISPHILNMHSSTVSVSNIGGKANCHNVVGSLNLMMLYFSSIFWPYLVINRCIVFKWMGTYFVQYMRQLPVLNVDIDISQFF